MIAGYVQSSPVHPVQSACRGGAVCVGWGVGWVGVWDVLVYAPMTFRSCSVGGSVLWAVGCGLWAVGCGLDKSKLYGAHCAL